MTADTFFEGVRTFTASLMNVSLDAPAGESVMIQVSETLVTQAGPSPFLMGLTVFILACFVGYYVVWQVTPALHSPLMAVTNAISSVIIVGALLTGGVDLGGEAKFLGALATFLAAINIFGGFAVTTRMLRMFEKKK